MLQELPQCDTGTESEHRPLGKKYCSMYGCYKTSVCKTLSAKHDEVNHSKTKYAVHIQTITLFLCKWIMVNVWFCVLISYLKS